MAEHFILTTHYNGKSLVVTEQALDGNPNSPLFPFLSTYNPDHTERLCVFTNWGEAFLYKSFLAVCAQTNARHELIDLALKTKVPYEDLKITPLPKMDSIKTSSPLSLEMGSLLKRLTLNQ